MDYFRSTSTGLGETVEYHGLLQEYHCRTWGDCGIPWITSGIPLQDLERLWNIMDYFRNTTAGLGETVGLLQEYHCRTLRDCGIPWITNRIPLQDLGRLWNTMDYFRNTTTGLGETVEYHGLLQEYH